ncbi:aryl-alcohol dehydrogenase [Zafaria cholistanensis]|uniref:Aryl-alcohol dehydrogenase n=1 Tax=Zafaria cholistanensis TaxID=1682741 RepID=A0A5A7NTF4_9MICC|nr:NAD(P)-dependent alcohol dehydrogenase [Zafaria cholistanensis]GER23177.1 aryl-alcohol dehydrogenase [Zafaria cholistanensis]
MTLMTAAVVRDPDRGFELEQVRLDAPRADEVLVRLVATGICHTDLGVARGTSSPRVLGHEGAGVVERVGSAVDGVKPGDKVILSFACCGECDKCLGGTPAHCRHFIPLNMAGARHDGSLTLNGEAGEPIAGSFFGQSSFAQYALTSPRNLVPVPQDTPEELLRILGPLGCGIQTGAGAVLNSLRVRAGSSMVITGAGSVGLSALLAGLAAGCTTVAVADLNPDRLALARELGATATVNVSDADALDQLRAATGGGADYAVETSGAAAAVRLAVDALDVGGVAGLVGLGRPGAEIVLDHATVGFGRSIVGIVEGDSVPQTLIPALLRLHLAGRFPFDRLVTLYPFDQFQQAVEDSISGTTIKAVVVL